MSKIDRRDFLKGCGVAAIAAGSSSRAFAYMTPPDIGPAAATNDTLVIVFLRGAMDGLSLLPPGASSPYRTDYVAARSNTIIPVSGAGAALPLNGTTWALHPRASKLRDLYNQNRLAFIVGAGQAQPIPVIRSHFDAQANLEFGFGGGTGNNVGWLTRHLISGGLPAVVPLPATSFGNITASSLLGSSDAITMASASDYRLDGFHWSWDDVDQDVPGLVGAVSRMHSLWNGNATLLESAGVETLASLDLLRPINFGLYHATNNPGGYQPTGGANYSNQYNQGFCDQLRNIAQIIKLNLGMRIATIDLGGWDTRGTGQPNQQLRLFRQSGFQSVRWLERVLHRPRQQRGGQPDEQDQRDRGQRVRSPRAGKRRQRHRPRLRQRDAGTRWFSQRRPGLWLDSRPGHCPVVSGNRCRGDHRLSTHHLRSTDPAHGQSQHLLRVPRLFRLHADWYLPGPGPATGWLRPDLQARIRELIACRIRLRET
ncbi:MAG: twin-arginine translocation signal domain-containing protein [Rhodocyclaceae bacterium]|nr:MAG: twin-arginine translocation signal domain-containing protein [Rhodocyclaceae bacterium]